MCAYVDEQQPRVCVVCLYGGVDHSYAVSVGQKEGGREMQSEGCILNRLLSPRQHLAQHTQTNTHQHTETQIHKCMLGCSTSYIHTHKQHTHVCLHADTHIHSLHASSNFGCLARLPVAMATIAHSTLQPKSMAAPRRG